MTCRGGHTGAKLKLLCKRFKYLKSTFSGSNIIVLMKKVKKSCFNLISTEGCNKFIIFFDKFTVFNLKQYNCRSLPWIEGNVRLEVDKIVKTKIIRKFQTPLLFLVWSTFNWGVNTRSCHARSIEMQIIWEKFLKPTLDKFSTSYPEGMCVRVCASVSESEREFDVCNNFHKQ